MEKSKCCGVYLRTEQGNPNKGTVIYFCSKCGERIRREDGNPVTIMYCHWNSKMNQYQNFYVSRESVAFCGVGEIFKVSLREVEAGEKSQYWAWFENGVKRFNICYPRKEAVEMCFPYGHKVEEEKGRGRLVNVSVTVAEK